MDKATTKKGDAMRKKIFLVVLALVLSAVSAFGSEDQKNDNDVVVKYQQTVNEIDVDVLLGIVLNKLMVWDGKGALPYLKKYRELSAAAGIQVPLEIKELEKMANAMAKNS